MSKKNDDNYARRRKKKWKRNGKVVKSKKPIGAPLWKKKEKDYDFIPNDKEISKVKKKGREIVKEVEDKILKKYNFDNKNNKVVLAGSTNPKVLTFVANGNYDFDVFVIVNDVSSMRKIRKLFSKEFPGGNYQGKVEDELIDLKPYNVEREGVEVDYNVITKKHERYTSVNHTSWIIDKINEKKRKQIIKLKYYVKNNNISIVQGGVTSIALTVGVIKYGARNFCLTLIKKLEKWLENGLKDKERPFLEDPCLKGRNLLATIPGDKGIVKRLIIKLKELLDLNVERKPVKKGKKLFRVELKDDLNKLDQDIVNEARGIVKRKFNNQKEKKLVDRDVETEVFVDIKKDSKDNKYLHIHLPRVEARGKVKKKLPIEDIPKEYKEKSIKKFKKKYGDDVIVEEGDYYAVIEEESIDYQKIKNKIKKEWGVN